MYHRAPDISDPWTVRQRPQTKAASVARALLVALAVFGVYTNLSIAIGPSRLYGYLGVFSGLSLMWVHLLGKGSFYRQMASFMAICALIILGGPDVAAYGVNNTLSAGQFLLSVAASIGIAAELLTWNPRTIRRFALCAAVAVSVLAILETEGSIRAVSDAFRTSAYGSDDLFVYDSDVRDEQLHGSIRPKVFTQEPSHPAKFVAVMIAIWFLLNPRRTRWVGAAALLALATFALRSPTIAIALVVMGFNMFGSSDEGQRGRWWRATLLVLFALTLCTVEMWVGFLPFERARAIAIGEDPSSVMRMIAPIPITAAVLADYPWFGLGLGSREVAMPALISIYAKFAAVNIEAVEEGRAALWSNGLFQMICYTGIVGTIMLLAWLRKFAGRIYPGDFATVLVCFIVIFSFEGTFTILRPWAYFFLLLVALQMRREVIKPRRLSTDDAGLARLGAS